MRNLLELFAGKRLFFVSAGIVMFFCLIIWGWYQHNLGFEINPVCSALGNMLMIPMLFVLYGSIISSWNN
jgi:hypothetical protein